MDRESWMVETLGMMMCVLRNADDVVFFFLFLVLPVVLEAGLTRTKKGRMERD